MQARTDNPVQSDAELFEDIDKLVEENRVTCLWYMRKDYLPSSNPERISVLRNLETYGDRATFVKARNLRDCLLRIISATSAKP